MLLERATAVRGRRGRLPGSTVGREIRDSLGGDPPSIPTRYLYDDRGSELFERITRLPEYYQTRTEESLLERFADEIVSFGAPSELVELGSGSGRKIRLLLDGMKKYGCLRSCVLFDINRMFLRESVDRLSEEFPEASFRGVAGSFMTDLPSLGIAPDRMVIFLAGTIGNIYPRQVAGFLLGVRESLGGNGWMLVGLDRVKDRERLEAAYNDSEGVTAEFNRNILRVVNRRARADFPVEAFEHVAFWDRLHSWIELRLRANRDMTVSIREAAMKLHLERGDEIRTEISCKYTRRSFTHILEGTGFELARWFTDPDRLFSLALLRAV